MAKTAKKDTVEANEDVLSDFLGIGGISTPEVKKYDEIYDKYDYVIKQLEDGAVHITYPEMMEILRYVERRIGNNIPMNMSCSNCIHGLIKQFKNLK